MEDGPASENEGRKGYMKVLKELAIVGLILVGALWVFGVGPFHHRSPTDILNRFTPKMEEKKAPYYPPPPKLKSPPPPRYIPPKPYFHYEPPQPWDR
jgi:hypothetical protein